MNGRQLGMGMTSQRTRLRMVQRLREEGIRDEVVLAAISEVPRHLFVDEALADRAYDETALPIGFGQTISSPWIVARTLEIARAGATLKSVLEIGTGCGYQTVVLSRLSQRVYSVERISSLLIRARVKLRELRVGNVKVKHADGHLGLSEVAPFDAIVMAAAATHVPQALLEQVAEGGRIVLPLGTSEQHLTLVERTHDGYTQTQLDPVRFVPLVPGIAR